MRQVGFVAPESPTAPARPRLRVRCLQRAFLGRNVVLRGIDYSKLVTSFSVGRSTRTVQWVFPGVLQAFRE